MESLQGLILEEQARPWWDRRESRSAEPAPKQVSRKIEEVVFPLDRASDSLRRMVQAGQLAGLRWDPDRGVIRETTVLRMVG